ncbi:MAG: type I methionyl aminopeptidase [Planctomycetaceae bacterium]|nr:type I methionyl aminopeptidase [Planctomycetaceae bacterium]
MESILRSRPPIYNREEREKLREASRFNAQLMDYVRPHVKAGITTDEINTLVHDYTLQHGHVPATLGYKGYPKSCCTSINEVVCHGIPDDTVLQEGDIINVDITSIVNGWYGDQSETFLIGEVSETARRLVQVTFDCLFASIHALTPNCKVYDIGKAIYDYVKPTGFSIVREFQGHGLGRNFHQDPGIPHYPEKYAQRDVLRPGTCFTIEPMINEGLFGTEVDPRDGWTARTIDRKLTAQFEHTILMTEEGPEILTLTKEGPQEGHIF